MVKHTQFVGKLTTNCLSLFDHFVRLALKGLTLSRFHTLFGCFHCGIWISKYRPERQYYLSEVKKGIYSKLNLNRFSPRRTERLKTFYWNLSLKSSFEFFLNIDDNIHNTYAFRFPKYWQFKFVFLAHPHPIPGYFTSQVLVTISDASQC